MTEQLKQEIDQVIDLTRNNINQLNQRGETLESLQTKADSIQSHANTFRREATNVRKKLWWKDMKMKILIVIVIIAIILAIVLPLALKGPPK
jgi:vesicle-associated membrane protein 4